MTQALTPEEQEAMGVSPSIQYFRKMVVDNGDDKNGTNKTGDWVVKTKTPQGLFERQKFGKQIEGVVIMARAQISSPFTDDINTPSWYSNEFISGNDGQVFLYLKGSKRQKIVDQGTYKEIQTRHSHKDIGGKTINHYDYASIIYVLVGDEVFKVQLTGQSQGQWFDYTKSTIIFEDANRLKVKTVMKIVELENDKGTKNFVATFTDGGQNENFDGAREALGDAARSVKVAQIAAPQAQAAVAAPVAAVAATPPPVQEQAQPQTAAPTPPTQTGVPTEAAEVPPIEAYEADAFAEDEEVKIEDVPF